MEDIAYIVFNLPNLFCRCPNKYKNRRGPPARSKCFWFQKLRVNGTAKTRTNFNLKVFHWTSSFLKLGYPLFWCVQGVSRLDLHVPLALVSHFAGGQRCWAVSGLPPVQKRRSISVSTLRGGPTHKGTGRPTEPSNARTRNGPWTIPSCKRWLQATQAEDHQPPTKYYTR